MIALIALGESVSKLTEMSGLRTLDSGQTADQVAALSKLVPSGPVVLSISHWFCQYLFTKYLQSKTSKRKDPQFGPPLKDPFARDIIRGPPVGRWNVRGDVMVARFRHISHFVAKSIKPEMHVDHGLSE